ncbi:MAG: hypothetical protein HOP23_01740 [Methylococcaceae bacterium]|nr:hypothetical protein [Methylococcaceae bacterium]
MLPFIRSSLITAFFLLYPYLVFRGLQEGVVWLGPMVIASLFFYQGFRETRFEVRIKKLLVASTLIIGLFFFQALTAKLMPTLIQLVLMYFFGKTLQHDPPLIERFVRLEFPELPPEIIHYCRQLTFVWTFFFAFNALVCSGLAVWGPSSWWAIYSGVIIFLLTGLLMIGEYIFRHYHFPDLQIPDMKTSARNMVINARKIWQDMYAL